MRRGATACICGLTISLLAGGAATAQDFSALRINEVIADNGTQDPRDVAGGTPDMVEIYNTSGQVLELGVDDATASLALSDTPTLDTLPEGRNLWTFPKGLRVLPGDSILVFCDETTCQNDCEPHANFRIASDGSEPITLWGPEIGGTREIIDQVWLPPLREDVSFGRFPDGAGPAPMLPVEDTLNHFVFNPPGSTTFGTCTQLPQEIPCGATCGSSGDPDDPEELPPILYKRFCLGGENGSGDNLEPRVFRADQSNNSPLAGEPVLLALEVEDDSLRPGDSPEVVENKITEVQIVYRVDGGEWQTVDVGYDAASGVCGGTSEACRDPERPLRIWTLWNGEIPGQPANSRVEFYLRVEDEEGLSSTRPRTICPEGTGPCDRQFGGPGCARRGNCAGGAEPEGCEGFLELADLVDCDCCPSIDADCDAELFVSCEKPFTYAVGYEPRGGLADVVINEICAAQTSLYQDPSSIDEGLCGGSLDDPAKYCCLNLDPPDPACGFDDFIEIHNTSAESVDVSGCWLSDRYFHPRTWKFPDGSVLPPGVYAIVWLDDDGSKCPDPSAESPPDFWECPDPNTYVPNPGEPLQFHANFELSASSDQIFLFDNEENNFGLVHGHTFEGVLPDTTLSLCPDGIRGGTLVEVAPGSEHGEPTPGRPNELAAPGECRPPSNFKRGDANADCNVDLSDGVFVLNFLFLGGPKPTCLDAADASDAGRLDISSGIFVFNFLFLGGAPPPAPGPAAPGPDPTEDTLSDCVYPSCP